MTLKTPWPICTTCQAIPLAFFRNEAVDKPYLLWPTFSAFEKSTSIGCYTCTLLFEAVKEPFKHRLNDDPVHLEISTISSNNTRAVALTVDLASGPDHGAWDESLWKATEDQTPKFRFVPVADVEHVPDVGDIPPGARHFKGKMPCWVKVQ